MKKGFGLKRKISQWGWGHKTLKVNVCSIKFRSKHSVVLVVFTTKSNGTDFTLRFLHVSNLNLCLEEIF